MGRRDLRVISGHYWSRGTLPIDALSPSGFRLTYENARNPDVHWDRVVPLWIDEAANVRVVRTLAVESADGRTFAVSPPRAARLLQAVPKAAGATAGPAANAVRLVETAAHATQVRSGP